MASEGVITEKEVEKIMLRIAPIVNRADRSDTFKVGQTYSTIAGHGFSHVQVVSDNARRNTPKAPM